MSKTDGIELARGFVQAEFVDRGMIADLNVHWDIGADGQPKPDAHVMLTMREVGGEASPDGFGAKVRAWNDHETVERWRERWEAHVNARLSELDIDARIDRRSLADQGIDLEPQSKIGGPAQRMERQGQLADRAEMHREIERENGMRIIANVATIHKAQGMTVDRTHVLVTPGMDRHGAYVSLSRHRHGLDLHYGGDDFKDQSQLVRALSRDRAKDNPGRR